MRLYVLVYLLSSLWVEISIFNRNLYVLTNCCSALLQNTITIYVNNKKYFYCFFFSSYVSLQIPAFFHSIFVLLLSHGIFQFRILRFAFCVAAINIFNIAYKCNNNKLGQPYQLRKAKFVRIETQRPSIKAGRTPETLRHFMILKFVFV